MSYTVQERVDRGIEKLEEKDPLWYRNINACRLRMENCYDCVLGQTYGEYHDGLRALELTPEQAISYGFEADGFNSEEDYKDYNALTAEWQRVIESYDTAT